MLRVALVSILALVSPAHLATAETITVCASGCDYTSINAAIAAASDGDVIQLSAETYYEGEVIDTLGKAITLRGAQGADGEPASVLNGATSHRVLQCRNGESRDTVLEYLLVERGLGVAEVGGGMLIEDSSPTITGCGFRLNYAEDGGAIGIRGSSSPELVDCLLSRNVAVRGGGVDTRSSGVVAIRNCTFVENRATQTGAAMYNLSSDPLVNDSAFIANFADYFAGAVYNYQSKAVFSGCSFSDNRAFLFHGGAFYNDGSTDLRIEHSQFTGNEAGDWGGAVFSIAGGPEFAHCVFESNFAPIGTSLHNYFNTAFSGLESCTFVDCCAVYPPSWFRDEGGNAYEPWCDDCRGNIDCRNDAVDAQDLGFLLARWGTNDPQSDIDGDGLVTASDLGFLFAAWGPCQ